MGLNIYQRDKLRKSIEEILKHSPNTKKVSIKKEVLEQLLFEEVVLNEKENIVIKLPVWSGEFLEKIDLSEVDFTNVSWGGLYYLEKNNDILDEEDILEYYNALKENDSVGKEILIADINYFKESNLYGQRNNFIDYLFSVIHKSILDNKSQLLTRIKEISKMYRHKNMHINYSRTNAKIDLSKSFESTYGNKVCVCDAEFKECNIYISKKTKKILFYSSDFSSSTINLPKVVKDTDISECSFENCDLSKTSFDVTMMVSHGINLNNLNNSGTRIIYKNYDDALRHFFIEKYLNGCYKSGELINKKRMR